MASGVLSLWYELSHVSLLSSNLTRTPTTFRLCPFLQGVCCETFGRQWQVWLVAKLFSGFAVGSVQFLTGSYITEIAPARIRGFLLIFYSIWCG
jgi:MFS family permease